MGRARASIRIPTWVKIFPVVLRPLQGVVRRVCPIRESVTPRHCSSVPRARSINRSHIFSVVGSRLPQPRVNHRSPHGSKIPYRRSYDGSIYTFTMLINTLTIVPLMSALNPNQSLIMPCVPSPCSEWSRCSARIDNAGVRDANPQASSLS